MSLQQVNQNFLCAPGDAPKATFTAYNTVTGAVLDISTATQISWTVREQASGAAVATLTKTGGAVTIVSGPAGTFQVAITAAITNALSGWYIHEAAVTLADGTIYTGTVGRMQVSVADWSYNPAAAATVPLFGTRFWIGDTIVNDQQLKDGEITFALNNNGNDPLLAAVDCLRSLASRYSRLVDTISPGELQTRYSSKSTAYAMRARELEALATKRGIGVTVFAGGISILSKDQYQQDPDRVLPSFNIGMMDAKLPLPQLAQELMTNPSPVGGGTP